MANYIYVKKKLTPHRIKQLNNQLHRLIIKLNKTKINKIPNNKIRKKKKNKKNPKKNLVRQLKIKIKLKEMKIKKRAVIIKIKKNKKKIRINSKLNNNQLVRINENLLFNIKIINI